MYLPCNLPCTGQPGFGCIFSSVQELGRVEALELEEGGHDAVSLKSCPTLSALQRVRLKAETGRKWFRGGLRGGPFDAPAVAPGHPP